MVKSFVRLVPTKSGDIVVAVSVVEQRVECLETFGTLWTQSPQETLFDVVALCLFRFSGWVVMLRSNLLVFSAMQTRLLHLALAS
jgi:hypothetical protein